MIVAHMNVDIMPALTICLVKSARTRSRAGERKNKMIGGFIVGMVFGGTLGVAFMCLLVVGGKSDGR